MYRMDGRRELPEHILKNFEGYKKSQPVRIGNAACEQLQLDIYGELLDSILIYDKHGEPISYDFWMNIVTLVEWVCKNWQKPDEGIWEVRGGARPFLYSRVMCWVAIDRAMTTGAAAFVSRAARALASTSATTFTKTFTRTFWNPKLKSFVQYQGAQTVDASSLLLPMVKFISPTDPRWKSTMQAIEKNLVEDSLVYRYIADESRARRNARPRRNFFDVFVLVCRMSRARGRSETGALHF